MTPEHEQRKVVFKKGYESDVGPGGEGITREGRGFPRRFIRKSRGLFKGVTRGASRCLICIQ
jgi:hypothetical protein